MDQEISVPTQDHKRLYGIMSECESPKGLIIFIHGLLGSRNQQIFYNAAGYFAEQGFDCLRFNFYGPQKDTRNLNETVLETYVKDINTMIERYQDEYSRIYLVGHSIGSAAMLLSKQENVTALISWDGTLHGGSMLLEQLNDFHEDFNAYYTTALGYGVFIPKPLLDSWNAISNEELRDNLQKPLKVVLAEKGLTKHRWAELEEDMPVDFEKVEISGAGHHFNEGGVTRELYDETLKWIEHWTRSTEEEDDGEEEQVPDSSEDDEDES